MICIFGFLLLGLDQWRPEMWNPRVEVTLDRSLYDALLDKSTWGEVTMLSKYTILLFTNINFVLTFLLLSKKMLKFSTYGVYVSSLVFYVSLLVFPGVFGLFSVILHSMWLSLLSDEMNLSSGLTRLSEEAFIIIRIINLCDFAHKNQSSCFFHTSLNRHSIFPQEEDESSDRQSTIYLDSCC